VGRHEEGGAFGGAQLEQAGPHPIGDVGVERRRRLVEDEQPGLVQRRLDDADQGSLARAQLEAEAIGEITDPEPSEAGVDGLGGGLTGEPVQAGEDRQRFPDAEAVGEREVAGDEPDLLHGRGPAARQPVAQDVDRPRIGRDRSEEHQERRRLARAVRASSPTRSPGSTTRSIPSTARIARNVLRRPRASRTTPTSGGG
jgi:hypothetical protein